MKPSVNKSGLALIVSVTVIVIVALTHVSSAQTPAAAPATTDDALSASTADVFPAWVAGRWRATPFEEPLSSEFHTSVYGPGARMIREVSLAIRPSGEGTFTVASTVRDRRGRAIKGTPEIQELRFTVGDLKQVTGLRPRYATRIAHAERRYPDDPGSAYQLEGANLELILPDGRRDTLDVRFDTPEGRGSFWETLRRAGVRRPVPST